MTTIAWILLACAGVYAVANWFAVTTGDRLLEYIAKPSVMAFLFGVVLTVDATDEAAQAWFAVAVAFSLAGDVFLMVPGDRFVPGLASFLLAHVAYVIGFLQFDLSLPFLAVGLVAAAILIGVVGARIVQAAREAGQEELVAPVRAYIVVIAAMAAAAFATGDPRAIVGALLFCTSDAMIGWNRFAVEPQLEPAGATGPGPEAGPATRGQAELPDLSPAPPAPLGLPGNARTWIMVTYHLGQALIVTSLV